MRNNSKAYKYLPRIGMSNLFVRPRHVLALSRILGESGKFSNEACFFFNTLPMVIQVYKW